MTEVKIQRLENFKLDLQLPKYQTQGSAGMDLQAAIDQDITLKPLQRTLVKCGIAIALPENYEAQIRPRSGLALKHGITVLNTPGTIDSDYRGEIGVILVNLSDQEYVIKRGDRVAQMVIATYTQANLIEAITLEETQRSGGGFGSTGS